jgi:hypothetical protein
MITAARCDQPQGLPEQALHLALRRPEAGGRQHCPADGRHGRAVGAGQPILRLLVRGAVS